MIAVQDTRGLSLLAAALVMALISGCSAVQSNVRGGFACSAPGGTCAPSTVIDDAALSAIPGAGQTDASARGKGEGADLVLGEGGASEQAPIVVQGRQPATGRAVREERSTGPAGHALRIVYPAYRDRDGQAHPRRLAYAPVDTSAWAAALKGRGHVTASANQPRLSEGLLGAALNAPPLGALTLARSEEQAAVIPPPAMAQEQGQDGGPAARASTNPTPGVADTSARTPAPSPANPTARIEAEVSALLAKRKPAGAGTFSGKVE